MRTILRYLFCLALAGLTGYPAEPLSASQPAQSASPVSPDDPAQGLALELRRFLDVFTTVQREAADRQPAEKLVYEGAIPSMLRQLDPHTQFFDPGQFEQLRQMEQSEQKGFGSIVSVLPGQVIFLQIFPGTPTGKAGIQPGDELVAIGNVAISGLEPEQIVQLLTEARQQRIVILVRRQGDAQLLRFTLTPELVDAATVDRAFQLSPGVGYIRITSWDPQTSTQLHEALEKLGVRSLRGLILDLRDNPGGVVKTALDAASMFLQPGQRILTAKGRTGVVESADVPKGAAPYTCKLAVVINGKTASASEILTGALQDHDRATIVGEPSYGKGLVQSVLPLSDGTGLALTTAFYYTPSGRSIQRPLHDSALSKTFAATDRPTFKTDAGRLVAGGGGIQPDIRVAPAGRTQLEIVLDASGAVTAFATHYLAAHTPLPEAFSISPAIMDDFKVFLSERNIQPGVAEWSTERPWISDRLLEEILTQAKGVAEGDRVAARRDAQIQAALASFDRDSTTVAAR
ncbi:MAG: S41 family peptidase [Acidobacteriaceae bacterium]|nr:S41 family peptidase [Acidobacteriaceae bacterium]